MRPFFDCEFIDRGDADIELLSIGIVREDGETYYAEPAEADLAKVTPWVKEHVCAYLNPQIAKPRRQIADEITKFAGPDPRWYAYVDHYDWVCLSGLYGSLVDRPAGWPWGSIDLHALAGLAHVDPDDLVADEVALAAEHGLMLPEGAHHALAGAWWDQRLWQAIQQRASDDVELAALVDA